MKKAKSGKKILIKILILVLTLCIVGGIFFAAYHIMNGESSKTYTSTLKAQKKTVDDANKAAAEAADKLSSMAKGDEETLAQITKVFTTSESEIRKAISATKEIAIPAKYQSQFDQLIAGMDYNKKIYSQALLLIKNPTSSDRDAALKDLNNYISEAASSYYKGEVNGISIELPNEILSLQGTIDTYSEDIYKEHQGKLEILNKNKEYYEAMDDIIKNFKSEMTDLSISFKKITNNQAKVSDVYSNIEKKLLSLTKISTTYNGLTAPSVAGDVHKSFNSVITAYISYCQDYESALLTYQDAGEDEAALAECSVTIGSLDNEYVDISNSFEAFKTSFDNSKDKYTDINNIK
jgi:hypothetical protein